MKNVIILGIVFIVCSWFFNSALEKNVTKLQNQIQENTDAVNALIAEANIQRSKIAQEKKVRVNNNILANTECFKCHNSPTTALPMSDKTLEEAIAIVRQGYRDMPQYYPNKAEAQENNSTHFIPTSTLRELLGALYSLK